MKYIVSLTLLKSDPGFVLECYCINYRKDLPFPREKTSEIMVLTRFTIPSNYASAEDQF
jgi:hypothetical protein